MKTTTTRTTIFGLLCIACSSLPARTTIVMANDVFFVVDLGGEDETFDYAYDTAGSLQFGYDHAKSLWGEGAYE